MSALAVYIKTSASRPMALALKVQALRVELRACSWLDYTTISISIILMVIDFLASVLPTSQFFMFIPGYKAVAPKVCLSFLSPLGWHTLHSHTSAEAYLTGWPNAQPQARD